MKQGEKQEINTFNQFGVSSGGEKVLILLPPHRELSQEEAIVLAAWLVVIAGDYDGKRFAEALEAVCST